MNVMVDVNLDIITSNIRKGKYICIGSGSGRQVYDLDNGYVIKVAKNRKGIAQNEVEYHIASVDRTNLFAKITHVSEDYMLLIMEKAECANNFYDIWNYFDVRSNRELFQIEGFQYIFHQYNLLPVDLRKLANWGMINKRPVIIDYGFTWKVKRKHYMPF
jgi:hypothetical protein